MELIEYESMKVERKSVHSCSFPMLVNVLNTFLLFEPIHLTRDDIH